MRSSSVEKLKAYITVYLPIGHGEPMLLGEWQVSCQEECTVDYDSAVPARYAPESGDPAYSAFALDGEEILNAPAFELMVQALLSKHEGAKNSFTLQEFAALFLPPVAEAKGE